MKYLKIEFSESRFAHLDISARAIREIEMCRAFHCFCKINKKEIFNEIRIPFLPDLEIWDEMKLKGIPICSCCIVGSCWLMDNEWFFLIKVVGVLLLIRMIGSYWFFEKLTEIPWKFMKFDKKSWSLTEIHEVCEKLEVWRKFTRFDINPRSLMKIHEL